MKKVLALILSLAMVVMSLAACGSSSTTTTTTAAAGEETTTAAEGGETTAAEEETTTAEQGVIDVDDSVVIEKCTVQYPEVNVINKDSVLTLFPWTSQVAACLSSVYEKLYDFDDYSGDVKAVIADASYDGNFLPGCDHEEGTGDYTVHIHEGVKDHAGNELTASDVKFSWDYVAGNKNEGIEGNVQSNKGARAVYLGCEVVDDYTLIFHFERELTQLREFDDCFADFFVMTEAGFNGSATALVEDECGTGPYTLKEFTSGSVFAVESYDDYWAADLEEYADNRLTWQNVDVINYLTLDDKAQQVTALETGEVDAIQDIAVDYLPLFSEGGQYADDFNIIHYLQSGCIAISPNNDSDKSLMGNQDLRLALFYATDPQSFVDAMGGDSYGTIVYSLFGAGQADALESWKTADNYQNVYDLELAAEYMEKAGYNGEELVLACQQSLGDAAELLQTMWTAAGFNITLNVCDQSTFNTVKTNGEFDINIGNSASYCGAVQVSRAWGEDSTTGIIYTDYVTDHEWTDMLATMNTLDGHTDENVDAWMQHCFDNAYDMGLCTTWINNVVNKDILAICRNGKNAFVPGGFVYAQE